MCLIEKWVNFLGLQSNFYSFLVVLLLGKSVEIVVYEYVLYFFFGNTSFLWSCLFSSR